MLRYYQCGLQFMWLNVNCKVCKVDEWLQKLKSNVNNIICIYFQSFWFHFFHHIIFVIMYICRSTPFIKIISSSKVNYLTPLHYPLRCSKIIVIKYIFFAFQKFDKMYIPNLMTILWTLDIFQNFEIWLNNIYIFLNQQMVKRWVYLDQITTFHKFWNIYFKSDIIDDIFTWNFKWKLKWYKNNESIKNWESCYNC